MTTVLNLEHERIDDIPLIIGLCNRLGLPETLNRHLGTHRHQQGLNNGHRGLNMFMDSGLGASMPLVILDETVEYLGLHKNEIEGTEYYWSPIESHGIGPLVRGPTQALGNVLVKEGAYWRHGFVFDTLISHQYLRHLGSWTLDFDNMVYYFPTRILQTDDPNTSQPPAASTEKVAVETPEDYVGSYEVAPGAIV